jgi:hypothetical protein
MANPAKQNAPKEVFKPLAVRIFDHLNMVRRERRIDLVSDD